MEVIGDIEGMKAAIRAEYQKRLRDIEEQKRTRLAEVKAKAKAESSALKKRHAGELEARLREARGIVLNEQKLSAKRRFEEAREAMISDVIEAARKRFQTVVGSKRYLDFVRKRVPKKTVVYGPPSLKKHFRGLRVEKGLTGIRFVQGNVICDLTLESLLEAKEAAVRDRIIKALW
jgi:vacuolar-type H+-ATPase subunit E/Vma4